ncbi:hypothetical protein ACH4C2_36475 [Streptomyces sp. NPDC018057]
MGVDPVPAQHGRCFDELGAPSISAMKSRSPVLRRVPLPAGREIGR